MMKNLMEIEDEIEKFRNKNPLDEEPSEVIELVTNDYEIDGNETLGYINEKTPIFTAERWTDDKYYGCNLYANMDDNLTLLETYDDADEITGKELARNVQISIEDGFAAGATYFIVPSN